MAWTETEAAPALKDCKDRKGRAVEGADRFGPMLSVAGAGISPKRPPRLPLRLMVSLPYPEHAFDQNDGDGSIGCAERRSSWTRSWPKPRPACANGPEPSEQGSQEPAAPCPIPRLDGHPLPTESGLMD